MGKKPVHRLVDGRVLNLSKGSLSVEPHESHGPWEEHEYGAGSSFYACVRCGMHLYGIYDKGDPRPHMTCSQRVRWDAARKDESEEKRLREELQTIKNKLNVLQVRKQARERTDYLDAKKIASDAAYLDYLKRGARDDVAKKPEQLDAR